MQLIAKDLKFHIKHCGVLNKDKVIYFIKTGRAEQGFFAAYRSMLELIYIADVCGMLPVVQFGREFSYAEPKSVNGTHNPYEYYFYQPTPVTVLQAKNSFNVVDSVILHNQMVQLVFNGKCGTYEAAKLYLKQLAKMQRKYIKLKPETERYVQNGIDLLIGNKKVLGVHVRGSDFKKNYDIHPIYVDEMDYITEIEKKLREEKWDKIFLATDDAKTLEIFKKKFGDRLIYYDDVFRTNLKTSVAFSENERENHHYKLGLEVIRDVYTLAACEGLVAGVSQVSTCAHIIKMSQGRDYQSMKIICKGYNHNNRLFMVYDSGSHKKNRKSIMSMLRGWKR